MNRIVLKGNKLILEGKKTIRSGYNWGGHRRSTFRPTLKTVTFDENFNLEKVFAAIKDLLS